MNTYIFLIHYLLGLIAFNGFLENNILTEKSIAEDNQHSIRQFLKEHLHVAKLQQHFKICLWIFKVSYPSNSPVTNQRFLLRAHFLKEKFLKKYIPFVSSNLHCSSFLSCTASYKPPLQSSTLMRLKWTFLQS